MFQYHSIKLYFLSVCILCSFVSVSQTVLINEDFNTGFPSGWKLIDNDMLPIVNNPAVNFVTDAFVIRDNPDNPNVGDSILKATSWHEIPGNADDWLILPQVTLGAYGNTISFFARSFDWTHPEGIEVRVSTTGDEVADFLVLDPAYRNMIVAPYWTTYEVSLDSIGVTGQAVYIALRHFGNDQYLLGLDNIRLEIDNPVGINTIKLPKLNVYPNPSNGSVTLENIVDGATYSLINIAGSIVTSNIASNNLDFSFLPSGIYTLIVEGYQPYKLIIL